MDKIIFRIKRFDGTKEWFQEYEIPYQKGRTILWGLINIKETQDITLNFTSACRSAICGSCGVRVNGSAVLACKTLIDDMMETYGTNKLTIEPLKNFAVIRDLVIDWEPKFEKMKKVKPWLMPPADTDPSKGMIQSNADFWTISSSTDCIYCGICTSECGQLTINPDGYLDPFIFAKAYRYFADTRDVQPKEHLNPALENGLWKCLHCMQCVAKCPKSVKPAEQIAKLRQESMKLGYKNNKGARHAYAFHDNIKNSGRLNELTLPMKTEGIFNTAKRIPFALRLMSKGKVNPLDIFPKPVRGIDGVKKIFKLARKEAK